MHRLLYLAQGHHLVWCGTPLFGDTLVITDVGVLVAGLRGHELDGEPGYGALDNGQLNAVGYVLSRYGNLSVHDLDLLTRHSAPAVEAGRGRIRGTAATIRHDAMADYFTNVVDVDPDERMVNAEAMADLLKRAREQAARYETEPPKPDDMDNLRKWVADYAANYRPTPDPDVEDGAEAKADARTG
jgi:hypothetical protein